MSESSCWRPRGLAALAAGLVILAAQGLPAAQEVPQLQMTRIADGTPPVIDGRVDDEAWSSAPVYSEFIQQEPNDGRPATERTEVRFLLDNRHLYVGVIAYDSEPHRIVVTESRRDANLNDTDSIQILLDTFNDGQNAFVFGTNPFGIEYDGQVASEGQTGGGGGRGAGGAGSQRGTIGGFNPNWDGDWTVRARMTERGWEAEFAIPLRTLRYNAGPNRTWGVNVMRNIRRKNEQVYLAPVPRGYTLHRVSVAAKIHGLDLPPRRDVSAIPFVTATANRDVALGHTSFDRTGDVGLDMKWGVRPDLTLDLTVNTDFAQVEADDEQVNLTRFPLFFPEKRGFFLENASMFQLGQPQAIDLFFSRRIGLSSQGTPIGIVGGARLSGKIGEGVNIGLLNMQTESAASAQTGALIAPANNFTVARIQREVGRSNVGGMFVNRQGTGRHAGVSDFNRAYGLDTAIQLTTNGRLFAFLARTDSPAERGGSDYAGRVFYSYANPLWNGALGFSQVGDRFNPEVGFLPRRGFRRIESRFFLTHQPEQWPWIRRISPHVNYSVFFNLQNELESSRGHWHFFEIEQAHGGRFGYFIETFQDRPRRPFTVFRSAEGRTVVIPVGDYAWVQGIAEYISNPSAPVYAFARQRFGTFYDGDYNGFDARIGLRVGARFATEVGWNRDRITNLSGGSFTNNLVPLKASYSFTSLSNVQALVQYNSQTSQVSSNIRFALLDRSGTGLFFVFNDRRDVNVRTPEDLLGRSFVVKYTRLFTF